MENTTFQINGIQVPVLALDTAVIGSGSAGFNAADWLYDLGRRDIALLTEGVNMGTSRNAGSDKQTYYKLSLASDGVDSVRQMALDLTEGGRVNGDTALAEAANSIRCFIKLANLGVPFPTNEYGEYVGYKTDHDPRQRATSAGPLTSRYMTQCLEASVKKKGLCILDGYMVFKLLVCNNHIEGLLCLNKNNLDAPSMGLTIIRARQVILATGGPAGCYFDSVYPVSQTGMTGMALEAGAAASNLDQWQYGLASTKFRWNVSGTYQQVLPRYISVDKNGKEREFLPDYFENPYKALDMVFLKGYQWPFHAAKIHASSRIDLLVHHEIHNLGHRVYLDFCQDPACLKDGFNRLEPETFHYLKSSGALEPTPIKRLERMNPQAIALYKSQGIDLYKEPLEIAVCAQHNNGGLEVDCNWETSIQGLYAAGEAAGTFGPQRPGGSALNSGQVGSMRAAQHIAYTTSPAPAITEEFKDKAIQEMKTLLKQLTGSATKAKAPFSIIMDKRMEMQKKMSLHAAHIRDYKKFAALEQELKEALESLFESTPLPGELPELLKTRDIFMTQLAILSAMKKAAKDSGTAGCALVIEKAGEQPATGPDFTCRPGVAKDSHKILRTCMNGRNYTSEYIPPREMPSPDNWFENVWAKYRQRTEHLNTPSS